MRFDDAVKFGFIRYFNFTTRSSRSEYWWWVLFTILVDFILVFLNSMLFGPSVEQSNTEATLIYYDSGVFGAIFGLFIFAPSIAVGCRRLHDINKSGWWQFIAIVPLIGWAFLLYWFVKTGDDGDNRFGPNPLIYVT